MIEWNIEQVKRLTELVCDPEGYSESQIAGIMSEESGELFTRDAVHNKIFRLELRTLVDKPTTDIMPYFNKYREIIESDAVIPKSVRVPNESGFIDFSGKIKILYLGDPHIPFQVDEQIQTAVNRNLGADIVVTNEVMDCYSISRFTKSISVPFEVEVDNTVRYLEFLSETFPIVYVVGGNHEARLNRAFRTGVPPSLLFLVNDNILRFLSKPFPNVVTVERPYMQVNDAVFTHAEYFSKIDLRAGMSAFGFLREWQGSLGLRDFRLIVQAHSHMLGSTYRAGDFKIMEGGTLTMVPDYAVDNFYSKPQTNGYIVVVQKDGVTDFNLTREFSFPTQKYIPHWSPVRRHDV